MTRMHDFTVCRIMPVIRNLSPRNLSINFSKNSKVAEVSTATLRAKVDFRAQEPNAKK